MAQCARLESQCAADGFWENPQEAQAVMRRLTSLREEVSTWRNLEARARDLEELADLALLEGDESLAESLGAEAQAISTQVNSLEFQLTFSGQHDARDAILGIHAGAGGTESQDWAQMLLRMYLRWAEKRGFRARVLDLSPGEEAGVKSVAVEVNGKHAYGWLKAERGVHRLVRLSPFDAAHLRHTSFALVEVLPEAEENVDISIKPEELRIDVFRASGAGGQNVQKTATAVRMVHLPTGITVSCQNERSQHQNREVAMKILRARLMDLDLRRRAEEVARLKGEHIPAEWGNQIRSYVLHPYKLVKDHRTGYESSEPESVLDGELDDLLRAYLLSTLGKGNG
ncbi:MAG: peptide chain release factor 2 [Chloroflexi bacterium]|nr:peptide chain release factor 2 [Chloroflexota bacterium]